MERQANYALVGVLSMLLFVGLVVFVVWLARAQFANQYDIYNVDFKGPVRGLSNGGDVYFNGIKVGEVTKLSLDKSDPNRVVARIRTSSDAPVRIDSLGTLEPQGITGVTYIQITAGTTSKPLLKDVTPRDVIPTIQTTRGALDSLLEGGGTLLQRAVDSLDRVDRLMSDKNISTVGATLDDLHSLTTQLKSQQRLFSDADRLLVSLNATSVRVQALTVHADGVVGQVGGLVNGDGRRTLDNLNATVTELKGAATDARALVARLQGPTGDFASTALPQLSQAIGSLQQATDSLNRVVGDVEQNPRGVLTKAPAKQIEVKP